MTFFNSFDISHLYNYWFNHADTKYRNKLVTCKLDDYGDCKLEFKLNDRIKSKRSMATSSVFLITWFITLAFLQVSPISLLPLTSPFWSTALVMLVDETSILRRFLSSRSPGGSRSPSTSHILALPLTEVNHTCACASTSTSLLAWCSERWITSGIRTKTEDALIWEWTRRWAISSTGRINILLFRRFLL